MYIDYQVNRVKDSIVNSTIFLIGLLLLPTSVLHIFRAMKLGPTPITYIVQVWLVLYILLFIFRNRILLNIKITIVIISLYIEFFLETISMGMLSTHIAILIILFSLSAMYVGFRVLLLILIIGMITLSFLGLFWTQGLFSVPINPEEFMQTPISWGLRIYSTLVLSMAVTGSIYVMMKHLKEAIIGEENKRLEIEELLTRENTRLEQLVDEKTKEIKGAMKEIINKEKLASLGSLVAGVSHEINTPLGVSVTAASHLSDINIKSIEKINSGNFKKEDLIVYFKEVEETNEILNNNLYKASELVKSFKAISVNQTSSISTNFSLLFVIESTILTLKHEYKNREIHFKVDVDESIILNSYPGVFSQIFTNLIMNSLTHGFLEEDSGEISITATKIEEEVVIIYRDNGRGIPENSIGKIYDPFFTTNRGSGGSGLGLNIIYNLISEKLNGFIHCKSIINQGVEFSIQIPNKEIKK